MAKKCCQGLRRALTEKVAKSLEKRAKTRCAKRSTGRLRSVRSFEVECALNRLTHLVVGCHHGELIAPAWGWHRTNRSNHRVPCILVTFDDTNRR